jgi:type IV pilus assembly protein PilA
MIVVAIIGILAAVAVVAYSRYTRKAKSNEVVQIFGELKAKEEAYHSEFGRYLGACKAAKPAPGVPDLGCVEGDYFPEPLVGGNRATDIPALPERWVKLKVQPGKGALYCQYEAVAGPANQNGNMGVYGSELYADIGGTPTRNWFYLLAQCDWDGNPAVNATYQQRGDLTALVRENEQR